MNKEEVLSKVKEIIVDKIGVHEDSVTLDANLQNDLGCDSLDIIEIAMEIEKEYKIEITGEKLQGINTVGDLWKHTYDILLEKEMTVQPVEKVEKKEAIGLKSAEDIYEDEFGKWDTDPQIHGKIIAVIKEAQRNAIEVTVKEMENSGIAVLPSDLKSIKELLLKQIK
jgi:acyl carrier protein